MAEFKECKVAEEIRVAPTPERLIGNFRLESLIGRGAMGSVYRAQHTILEGKTVAIKMLHQHLCTEQQALKRFRQEAESASSLHHPGIVAVQDFGVTDDGQPYLVMDFVEGTSLSEILREGPMEPERALKLAAQICEALQAAHERGLVHRDIKPSNLILTNPGTSHEAIKVVDFGIAKFLEDTKTGALTQTGEAMGSPPYMSPEQCAARPIDARSDLYSLGCVLHEMLAGRAPFVSESIFEMVHDHVATIPESLSTYRRGLPNAVAFDAMLLKVLAKDPDERFTSAAEFKNELDALRRSLSTKLTLAQRAKSHWKVLSARGTAKKALVAGGLLVLSSCAVLGGIHWVQQVQRGPTSAQTQNNIAEANFESAHQRAEQFAAASDWKNAAEAYAAALQAGKALGSENKDVQSCMSGLAKSLTELGRTNEAKTVSARLAHVQQFDLDRFNPTDDASEIARLTMEHTTKPNDLEAKHRLLAKLSAQAKNFITVKQDDDALNCANTILTLTKPDDASDFPYRTAALYATARAHSDAMDFPEAEKSLAAMSEAVRKFGEPHKASVERAELYQALGRFFTGKQIAAAEKNTAQRRQVYMTTAREYFTKAQNDYRQLFGKTSPYLADALSDEAFSLHAENVLGDSDALMEAGLSMALDYRGPADARSGRQYLALAHSKVAQAIAAGENQSEKQKFATEAKALTDKAEATIEKGMTKASIYQMALVAIRGRIMELLNDSQAAEADYLRALDLGLKSGKQTDEAKFAYSRLIVMYQQQKRENDIKALMLRVNPTGNEGQRIVTES